MKELTAKVSWLTDAVGANCYWIDLGPGEVAIVDPGMSLGLNRVARELRRAGRSPYEVTEILLTHGDVDHAQAAAQWQQRTGARTWLGSADAAILTGAARPASTFRQFTTRLGTPELPGRMQLLDGDAEILPGLIALATPGHTGGHHCFVFDDVLIAGDAARCVNGALVPMPTFLNDDPRRVNTTVARLRALTVGWYACGHSSPARRA